MPNGGMEPVHRAPRGAGACRRLDPGRRFLPCAEFGDVAKPPAAYTPPFPLVYPIDAPRQFADTFGTARDGGDRLHQGGDLFAPKMAPVLATAAGRISAVDWSLSAGFYIDITHAGGWRSRYLHLNNDTPGTDDGLGFGIAEGIGVGASVAAGQVIGYVGDSGNAESSSPHLHFELRMRDWTAVNPYPFVIGRSSETTLYVLPELSDDPVVSGIEVIGHIDPGEGFNGDVRAYGDVAYLATIGAGETCLASGVRMYSVADPANPEELGVIAGGYEGTSTEQVWVGSIVTDHFVGDIAVVAHRICEGAGPEAFRGFTTYDVSDPAGPVSLGSYETGLGTSGVEGFDVWAEDGRVVVAAAVPNSLLDHMRSLGDVRFVDISDPANPSDIVDWDFRRDADPVDRDTATDGADPRDLYASDVTLDPDGRRAFVSLWDAGVVVLDVSTIELPQAVGWTGSLGHSEGKSGSTMFSTELQTLVVNHEDLDPLDDGDDQSRAVVGCADRVRRWSGRSTGVRHHVLGGGRAAGFRRTRLPRRDLLGWGFARGWALRLQRMADRRVACRGSLQPTRADGGRLIRPSRRNRSVMIGLYRRTVSSNCRWSGRCTRATD